MAENVIGDASVESFLDSAGVLTCTLCNPNRKNAATPAMLDQICVLLDEISDDVRVVVIRGHQGVFCAGFDISALPEANSVNKDAADFPGSDTLARTALAISSVKVPVIALLQGPCYGAGGEIAISADFRVASDDLAFCMPPAKLGLVYSADGLERFVARIGLQATKDLFYTARVVGATEASAMRLIDRVCSPDQIETTLSSLVTPLLDNAPLSLHGTKILLDKIGRSVLTADDHAQISSIRLKAFQSDDHQEGRDAFMQKRRPKFSGR